jgi:hypothetical protein
MWLLLRNDLFVALVPGQSPVVVGKLAMAMRRAFVHRLLGRFTFLFGTSLEIVVGQRIGHRLRILAAKCDSLANLRCA